MIKHVSKRPIAPNVGVDDGDDILSETFLTTCKTIPSYNPGESQSSFVLLRENIKSRCLKVFENKILSRILKAAAEGWNTFFKE
jgi:hypothetical protein